jgi:hypothetical protein
MDQEGQLLLWLPHINRFRIADDALKLDITDGKSIIARRPA